MKGEVRSFTRYVCRTDGTRGDDFFIPATLIYTILVILIFVTVDSTAKKAKSVCCVIHQKFFRRRPKIFLYSIFLKICSSFILTKFSKNSHESWEREIWKILQQPLTIHRKIFLSNIGKDILWAFRTFATCQLVVNTLYAYKTTRTSTQNIACPVRFYHNVGIVITCNTILWLYNNILMCEPTHSRQYILRLP